MMWVILSDSHHENAVSVCPIIGNVKFDQFLSDFSNGKRTFPFKLIIYAIRFCIYINIFFQIIFHLVALAPTMVLLNQSLLLVILKWGLSVFIVYLH